MSVIDQGIPTLAGFFKRDLGLSASGAGLLVSAYFLGKILGSYAAGIAADRLGERRVLVLGGTAAAAFVALAAAAGPLALVFALLLLAGVAGAAGTPAGGRLVLVAFPAERRGLALGIRQTGIPLGGIVAAAVLPSIAAAAGWRWSLVAAAGLALVGLVPLALTRIDRVAEPLLENVERPRGQDRNVYLLTLWACLIVSGQYALIVFLALDLHETASLSLAAGALLLALANATGIVGRVAWGAASDRALARGHLPLARAGELRRARRARDRPGVDPLARVRVDQVEVALEPRGPRRGARAVGAPGDLDQPDVLAVPRLQHGRDPRRGPDVVRRGRGRPEQHHEDGPEHHPRQPPGGHVPILNRLERAGEARARSADACASDGAQS